MKNFTRQAFRNFSTPSVVNIYCELLGLSVGETMTQWRIWKSKPWAQIIVANSTGNTASANLLWVSVMCVSTIGIVSSLTSTYTAIFLQIKFPSRIKTTVSFSTLTFLFGVSSWKFSFSKFALYSLRVLTGSSSCLSLSDLDASSFPTFDGGSYTFYSWNFITCW